MRFIKNNFWTMLATILVVTLSFVSDASAQTFFVTTQGKLIQLFQNVKLIVFIVGGFGLVAVAFAAIFGKIQWKWFAGLAAGLSPDCLSAGLAPSGLLRSPEAASLRAPSRAAPFLAGRS